MKLGIWIDGLFFFVLILQINTSAEGDPKANLTALQEKVERLIETVLIEVQKYYQQTEKEFKCLPENYTEDLMNAVKGGIDCIAQSHKQYEAGLINLEEHRKGFHKCFAKAKNEVEDVLGNINATDIKCPPEMVEKTFQINVTTSYTKTFNLNIQNGVEVSYDKTIQVRRKEEPCRNYPDVFSFYDTPGTKPEVRGILHHNPGGYGIGYARRAGNQEYAVSEGVTPLPDSRTTQDVVQVSAPTMEHPKQQPREDTAYAYFEGSHEEATDRPKEPVQPEFLRRRRNSVY